MIRGQALSADECPDSGGGSQQHGAPCQLRWPFVSADGNFCYREVEDTIPGLLTRQVDRHQHERPVDLREPVRRLFRHHHPVALRQPP